jgi:serine protein kinase
VEARQYLQDIGSQVSADFVKNRSILSFEEYVTLFFNEPRGQLRNAAQYLHDVMDHYGTEQVPHPTGTFRRFKLFDVPSNGQGGRVAGQEEVQNAVYRLLGNFVRAGRINKLILLHGPNGSAKSTLVNALKTGMEDYSHQPQGALYRLGWVFPSEKLIKGSIGFGERVPASSEPPASFAHLEAEAIDVRMPCELNDHPLFVVPAAERQKLLESALKKKGLGSGDGESGDFILSDYIRDGELCHKCRRIYTALLNSYEGDYLKVLRHVRIERFYISRRYQVGTVTVEPQMSVDAVAQQITADRTQQNLPAALHGLVLYEPHGPLVHANRGLIEYADLLKRPLEAFKYLLGFSETAEVPLEPFVMELDEVLMASANEKHLGAFKELPDFASFKGRIELVRVPYLRRYKLEQEVYDAEITRTSVGKHVSPHATEVAAMWAVLTRLKKPIAERYAQDVKELVDHVTPVEKMHLYEEGRAPARLSLANTKELKKLRMELYEESDAYPNYEGRSGASAREIKTALFNAAQNPDFKCLNALAVFEELRAICQDKSVFEFLQQEVVDGYHDHEEFVRSVEGQYLDMVDSEVRDSMGLVSEDQYRELVERYIQNVSHWVRGEKMRNRVTGDMERPDEQRMAELEAIVMPKGEDAGEYRRGLISNIGAHRLDNPDAVMDYPRIFPDMFKRLRDHYFEDRKRMLRKNKENVLKYLSEERASLSSREQSQVETTLKTMAAKYGYCEYCAKDAILFLMKQRYG